MGDWGKPNLLTRAGVPRIATNLLTYLLAPCVCYLLVARYKVAPLEMEALHRSTHNPFFLAAYGVFYVSLITDWFLRDRYRLGHRPAERFQFLKDNWKDIFVKISILSLAISLVLFLLGAFYFRQQLK